MVLLALALLLVLTCGNAPASDVAVVTHGEAVNLGDHMVPGKYVLFDFYADWCGPCRQLEPYLEELASGHEDELALRKVDIVNWSSAVAGQYRIHSIPHLKLFDPDGRLVAEGDAGRVLQALDQAMGGAALPAVHSRRHGAGMAVAVSLAVAAVAVWLVGSGRRRRSAPAQPPPAAHAGPGDAAGRVWYAMVDGSLVGPYTPLELAELARTTRVGPETRVRRKGDAGWHALSEVASSE